MRITCVLITLLIISLNTKSQVPPGAVAPEDAAFNTTFAGRRIPQVTGRLLNIPADSLKTLIISYALETPFSQFPVKKTTTARLDGSFNLELDYALPYQQLWFEVGEVFYAPLYANTDLYLELDMQKLKGSKELYFNGEGVSYQGTDGPLNIYLNNYILYKRPEQEQLTQKMDKLFSLQGDTAISRYGPLFDSAKKIIDQYIAANPSPYGWLLENEVMSDYYARICGFYTGQAMNDVLWQKANLHKSYLISSSSAQFYSNLHYYLFELPGRNIYPRPSVDRMIERIDSLEPPNRADFIKLGLNASTDVTEQRTAQEHVIKSLHTDWCIAVEKNELVRQNKKIDDINRNLSNSVVNSQQTSFGKPLFKTDFGANMYVAPDINALDFLAKLKEIFPGKAIIIDRWATWCVPCLQEMPHSKVLEESSKDLPVVFVYLCTLHNSSESQWKSKVVELKQPGFHFLITAKQDAALSTYFSFDGYPGYAFIDKAGNYKPGAFTRITDIADKEALAALISK